MKRRLLIVTVFLLAGAVVNVAVAWARWPTEQDIQRDLASLANTHSISIVVERGHLGQSRDKHITAYAVSELALRWYGPIFLSEFAVYPPRFVKATTLRRIVLCSRLALRGRPVEAITNLDRSTLYFDVGPSSSSYQRRTIHHEFFHVVDYSDDRGYADEEWEELNPPSFSYGSGGWSMRMDPTAWRPDDSIPGFLNKYSTSGVEEDKAEVFSHMIVDYAAVNDRTKTDTVLRHKVEAG